MLSGREEKKTKRKRLHAKSPQMFFFKGRLDYFEGPFLSWPKIIWTATWGNRDLRTQKGVKQGNEGRKRKHYLYLLAPEQHGVKLWQPLTTNQRYLSESRQLNLSWGKGSGVRVHTTYHHPYGRSSHTQRQARSSLPTSAIADLLSLCYPWEASQTLIQNSTIKVVQVWGGAKRYFKNMHQWDLQKSGPAART